MIAWQRVYGFTHKESFHASCVETLSHPYLDAQPADFLWLFGGVTGLSIRNLDQDVCKHAYQTSRNVACSITLCSICERTGDRECSEAELPCLAWYSHAKHASRIPLLLLYLGLLQLQSLRTNGSISFTSQVVQLTRVHCIQRSLACAAMTPSPRLPTLDFCILTNASIISHLYLHLPPQLSRRATISTRQ
jgi:hypothetical protein